MARRKKKEEHVNHERWLVSYADFITLLFAFFTSMYAISTVDAAKAGKMVFSTRSAFNLEFFTTDKPVLGLSNEKPPPPMEAVKLTRRKIIPRMPTKRRKGVHHRSPRGLKELARRLEDFIESRHLSGRMVVRVDKENVVVSLSEAAFFDSGAASIRTASLPALDTIAERIMDTGRTLRIEGHTDDRPIRTSRFRSNWQLSTARAVTVVSYLIEEFAYPPELLSAAGYASHRPVASNATVEGRGLNRRVDLVLSTDPVLQE